jgi:glycosyltransferase involved in cell wall biosynthesis
MINTVRSQFRPQPSPDLARHHVLYLIDRLSTSGGAEGALQKICRFLPADRFRCSVATFSVGSGMHEHFPCPIYVFPLHRIYGWNAFKYGLELSRFLRSERVDIMHTFFPASDIWGGAVATLSGCPILVSSRRDMGILRLKKHRLPYLFANHFADQIQAVSGGVREFCISEERLAPDKVVTVENGVDLEGIDAAPCADRGHTLGLDSTTPLVITTANPRVVKGIDVLIRAIAIVRRHLPNVKFILIGAANESYMRELLNLVADLGVADNIRFLGSRDDVFSLLKMADLFCLPSRSEGLSNALLEAMSCSLPCVATDVGGNSEVVVDGESGFLVPSEQPDSLAARILTLLGDRDLMKRMGQAGRQIVQRKFTVQHMVDRLTFLYDGLLQQRGLSSPLIRQRHDPDGEPALPRFSEE